MADLKHQDLKPSKLPIFTLAARIVTVASLVVSIAILKTTNVGYTLRDKNGNVVAKGNFSYTDAPTYSYVFFGMVVGFAYSFLQLPFAIYNVMKGKRLIKRSGFLLYEFLGDKVCLVLLATALGAAFGATVEIRRTSQDFETLGDYSAENYRKKMREYCTMAYVSGGFLLVGFISSVVLSIISSKPLSKK